MGKAKKNDTGANLGFEAKLWLSACKMRNNMDAAEYKHVVLGLIFPKYISDAFEEHHGKLEEGTADPSSPWYVKEEKQRYLVMEDRDEYLAVNVFWVPKEARCSYLQAHVKMRSIGPRTSWRGFTSTSCPRSPVPKARRAASSIRPAAWSACWSRGTHRTRGDSTIRAAARRLLFDL